MRMANSDTLPQKIDVTVIGGAGHVGLPLALTFAEEGYCTLIYDINPKTLETISRGEMPHMEHGGEHLLQSVLKSDNLHMTSDPEHLPDNGIIVITIGTPVDEFHNPVHKAIKECADQLLPRLGDGQLIILRSTVYPGTTEWLTRYLASKGKNIKVAFCPERVVQGQAIKELREIPQIISGTSKEAVSEAEALFKTIAQHIVHMEPMEAEFAKLFCNAVRYIQFAATNEFYMIADAAGLDYNRIYEGMTQHYPRAQQHARAGFAAGPCLFKDTAQLAAFAKNNFTLGNAAILVNEGLVLHVIEKMQQEYELHNLTVGLLGMAFKAEIDDIRSSLSYKMKKILALHANAVLTTDPYVTQDSELLPLETVLQQSDILVMCTPHKEYHNLDTGGKPVIDVWGLQS
jgi:UDP-N-acetyl-D-mannosaminuronic acid dehydrogenase